LDPCARTHVVIRLRGSEYDCAGLEPPQDVSKGCLGLPVQLEELPCFYLIDVFWYRHAIAMYDCPCHVNANEIQDWKIVISEDFVESAEN